MHKQSLILNFLTNKIETLVGDLNGWIKLLAKLLLI